MQVSDDALQELETRGFVIVPGFLGPDEVAAAQVGLWNVFPHPDDYHAEPEKHRSFSSSQFAGLRNFPGASWDVNRLAYHPDLVDAAERFLGTTDLELYKVKVWAKYSGRSITTRSTIVISATTRSWCRESMVCTVN